MRLSLLMATSLALTACATTGGSGGATPPLPHNDAEAIRFSAGPCFGVCPSYSITVQPDGSALFSPERFTAEKDEQRLPADPARYRALRDRLAAFRPDSGSEYVIGPNSHCERVATDLPGYQIRWTAPDGRETALHFYSGCFDSRYEPLRAAIKDVPATLGIEALLRPALPEPR